MSKRPNILDLRLNSSQSVNSASSRALRSPRMHVAGEAPPELSPLDAFALQSRLLAKQLQEGSRERRMSRLPPLTVESPLIVQGRSDYFRSMSQEEEEEEERRMQFGQPSPGLGLRTETEEPFDEHDRPMSMHPRMSRIPSVSEESSSKPAIPPRDPGRGRLRLIEEDSTFFGGRTERSPSPLTETRSQPEKRTESSSPTRRDHSLPLPSTTNNTPRPETPEQPNPRSLDDLGLAPPATRSGLPPRKSSTVSSQLSIHDEEPPAQLSGAAQALRHRKMSSGGGTFSAMSPVIGRPGRSPSAGSDSSALPRPSFNFSRPMSRPGTPNFEPPSRLGTPSRQASSDSQPSFILADDSAHTPVSMYSESFQDQAADDLARGAPSYIYSKFTLPRGKEIQRSEPLETTTAPASFTWDQPPIPPSNIQQLPAGAPPSPPTRPSTSSVKPAPEDSNLLNTLARPSTEAGKRSLESSLTPTLPPLSRETSAPMFGTRLSTDVAPRGRSRSTPAEESGQPKPAITRTPTSATTSDSASTIRPPTTARSAAPSASEMTVEEHLAKGIECHENGSLKESTYHLRYAARHNNPTAMLLYALACRHGWGMRENQKEGVEWLRKAAEYASIEIADDEGHVKEGKHVDYIERRTRKAQFALSIYELGVSHMNGWGIEQDKSLALRCFEIAGNWGDVDALLEAGFCYAKGVGCKKNLKTSARFYRMAEAKGMSMVGNSWIHKSKYMDDPEETTTATTKESPKKEKRKARSKSRTRAMFGLKS
ncbi:hypothetical protein V2G26_014386 [Clonostachys chloroleuca]|uniref:Protein DSF2 n=1 Tax=Clonostachys chloroleuca TaxID=1926264 RepID=A0AA35Q8B3_9HYPO|nr:unnamed protein product [Clonostachys chloroleuca]